LLVIVVRM